MKYRLTIAATLALAVSVALAAPTVTENTISWPDDGWYHVQDETSYFDIYKKLNTPTT